MAQDGGGQSLDKPLLDRAVSEPQEETQNIYEFRVKKSGGEEVPLKDYKGKVLLVVNTASNCGFTPQYAQLEELHQKFKEKGLVVMAFPSNDFGNQEPGSDGEIRTFCEAQYKITFPLMGKVRVSGEEKEPLFRFLTEGYPPPQGGEIEWNFTKFLIGRDGQLRARFASRIEPTAPQVVKEIERALDVKE